jgi:predicted RNA-binding Zn-ribbon protein involved in translation (DUF1610 family)/ribosomal protein S18
MPRAITEEQCRKKFEESGEYEVIEYRGLGNQTKHLIKHHCGYRWTTSYNNFTHGSCPDCAGVAVITEEKCRHVFEKSGEYHLLEFRGLGSRTKHLVRHNCGYDWEINYHNFSCGNRCPDCGGKIVITEEKCHQVFEGSGEYQLIEYRGLGSQTKHLIRHNCGYEWSVCYNNFINDHHCPDCAGLSVITEEKCRHVFEKSDEYQLLEFRGSGSRTKHLVRHNCGYKWDICYNNFFTQGEGCPNCSSFRTEKMSREIFERLFEHKFPKCRPKWLEGLELDGYCEELLMAFEYNGQQHNEVIPHFYHDTPEKFAIRREHDTRKKRICQERGIRLCVIPYTIDYRNPEGLERFIRSWKRITLSFMESPIIFHHEDCDVQLILFDAENSISS